MNQPVGRVLGTADATPLQFWVAVTPGSYLQLDDVVITHRDVPGREPVAISGVVTQVRARHEGAEFESDVFAIAEGTLPAQVQEAAEITTTRVEPEVYVPPAPGALVHRAAGDERNAALYFDRMDKRIPIGTGRDGDRNVECASHGGPKPAFSSASRPSSPRMRSTNSSAASAFSDSTTTAIGYWTTACASLSIGATPLCAASSS